jgi:hypothetical protein
MCHPAIFTALSSGAITGAAAGTLAVASGVGLAGYSILSARAAQKSSDAFAEQAYRDEQEQIASNRSSVILESMQKGNILKEEFIRRQATNRALLSPSGIGQSNSFEAAMRFNKSQFHRELNVIALEQSRKERDLTYASIDARRQLESTKTANKNAFQQQVIRSVTTAATAASGFKTPGTTQLVETDRIMGGLYGRSNPLEGV